SEFSPSEIASILAFSDQSHFTETFRKYTGVTPRKFQTLHLREMTLHVSS
ncbi:MAG: AraC family transcriptional regulator, partial [Lachnospiraceae bacterium]|nr:AraC family transcriptional regulator [Lachnospiraceae bacterium]